MEFGHFKAAVAAQWQRMQQYPLFRTHAPGDTLWETYLESFPPGTNEVYRERREYDCGCCKQFIRALGNVVAVIDGQCVSLWDVAVPAEPGFEQVARALSQAVLEQPLKHPFLHPEKQAGTDKNFEQLTNGVQTWTHFFVNIDRKFVLDKKLVPSKLAELCATQQAFANSLYQIAPHALETVLELIAQNTLYRGEENKAALLEFQRVQREFLGLISEDAKDLFTWTTPVLGSVARMRGTAIGTLLEDLTEGKELEDAVKSFEAKVAPTNYKRPTALITQGMITQAKEKIAELGLTSALDRRYARLTDITANNVLFADRSARKVLSGDVFDALSEQAGAQVKVKSTDKVEEVTIDRFVAEILPRVESVEVLFENQHRGHLVSLIAPVDPTAGRLFKWDNGFSWSYAGEVADAIKERVKQAGGNVTGDLCCRLAWHNTDDLDFHMIEPGGAVDSSYHHIYFGNKGMLSQCGGMLDVDMNVGHVVRDPVENIVYASRARMQEGVYHLYVHQYNRRETRDVGFQVDIDWLGTVQRFVYAKGVSASERITVARFKYTHKDGVQFNETLPSTQAVTRTWGLETQQFHRVRVLCLSPNHWDDKPVGNRHWFFMLEGCQNDGTARGFYNEFLKGELDKHRKVFEVVGSKMKPADSPEQLSGLGFSSTQKNTLVCRVKGSFTRQLKITF